MNQSIDNYRPDIDGLRAFSIIAVLIYHAFPTWLPGGFVGVDVFFVISGYLITRIILGEIADSGFSLAGFYRRRVQRIFPPLIPVLIFCLALGYFALLPAEYAQLGKHTAAASTFVPNLVFWAEAGYFDVDSKLKPLLHLWSLGVEEQFYLAWPLILLAGARLGMNTGLLIAILLATSFSLGITGDSDRAASFFLPHYRAWELLVGALLAWQQMRGHARELGIAAAAPGLLLLLAAVSLISAQRTFPGWWAWLPTAGAALVIASGAHNACNRWLGHRALVFVGKISFPLYLWHWPLLSFARIMEDGEPSPILRSAAVLLAVALAWASYRWVETPLRYRPGELTPWAISASLLAVGAVGLVIFKNGGLPDRTAPQNEIAAQFYWQELGLQVRDDCSTTFGTAGRCLRDGKPSTIVVLGDSHSTNTFFALAHHYRDSERGVIRLGKGGCPPLYNTAIRDRDNTDTCRAANNINIDWVAGNDQLDTVYLSSLGPMYVNPGQQRFSLEIKERPELTEHRDVFAHGLSDTVAKLKAAGKQVVVVVDWPSLHFDPKRCVDTRPLRLTAFQGAECTVSNARHQQRNRVYREVIAEVTAAHPDIQVWDTSSAFCAKGQCRVMQGDQVLYRDRSHLSLQGSNYLGEHLLLEPATAFKARPDRP
ncbi:hypothetical protein A3709_11065 [Halioglobus sp. HI00S01]|uniref:acyltransferase family protein n=1 Tax=Halioglobus sp. HI00S01 TaxID=1822214 RepID=UPI0007C325DF|nr:acyltransferase family protein [Halioglobus sp. HI00S01]KZX51349.1 hypothetical protein A3709_11065 [Halioglobus sp. HI00S01]